MADLEEEDGGRNLLFSLNFLDLVAGGTGSRGPCAVSIEGKSPIEVVWRRFQRGATVDADRYLDTYGPLAAL